MSENNANLSERSIKRGLSKTLLNDIDSIFIEDSTESTNDNAKEHLKTQKNLFSVHLAEQQISGRGRNNKKWVSPHGKNIYISLGWKSKLLHSQLEGLSLAVATSLISSLKEFTSSDLKIKWPNDLLVKNRKLCGILQEVIEYKNRKFLIIGIGINTKVSPKVANLRTISLLSCSNHIIKNNEILIKIKLAYEKIISGLRKGKISYLKRRAY